MQKLFTLGVEENSRLWIHQRATETARRADDSQWRSRFHGEHQARDDPVHGRNSFADLRDSRGRAPRSVNLRTGLGQLAAQSGLAIVAAGAHPFSHWQSQLITESTATLPRRRLAGFVRSILIFGLHVHVGIPDRDLLIEIMNEARYFLPHLLALSSNSPFWQGRLTGLRLDRTIVWQQFPRTGIPSTFASWADFESFVNLLVQTNCIDNGKKIWWDLRPHPYFATLEFRVCDMPTTVDDAIMLVGLFQAIVAKLYKLRKQNMGFRLYDRALLMENKWRAARYGIDGQLIDFGKREEVPMRRLAEELLEFVDDVLDELGSRKAVEYVNTILKIGTGADRQLEVFRKTGEMNAVVDYLIESTLSGLRKG